MEQHRLSRKRPRSPESSSSVKRDQGAAAAASTAVEENDSNQNKQVRPNSTKRAVASLSDLDSSDSEGDTPVASSSTASTRACSTQSTEPTSATAQPAAIAAASKARSAATITAAAPARVNEYDAIDDKLLAAALPVDTLVAIQSLQGSCYVTAATEQQANKKSQRKAIPITPAETSGRLVLQHQIYTVFENRTAGNDMHR
jgi:hypothetical protein